MYVTPLSVARRFIGLKELPGERLNNFLIVAMLRLDNNWPSCDETPWCSAFCNFICHILGVERSKNLAARSWLKVGEWVIDPKPGNDIVIFQRGSGVQPGPEVIQAPGHVGFYVDQKSTDGGWIKILGGNQGNQVSEQWFPSSKLLGIRRLKEISDDQT